MTTDTWNTFAGRATLEMLQGHLMESHHRWDALPRLRQPSADMEVEPWRLELYIWLHDPGRALDEALDRLQDLVGRSETRLAGPLLLMAARALADLTRPPDQEPDAKSSRRHHAQQLQSLHAEMPEDPLTPGPLRPVGEADGLLWVAEWARATGSDDAMQWKAVADAYQGAGLPHPAGYARWREGEAELIVHGRSDHAILALREASRMAATHAPLHAAIERLAARVRIDLTPGEAPTSPVSQPFGLTRREMSVLEMVARGKTNRQIGSSLFISSKTVDVHVANILRKLKVGSRLEAALVAERTHLFPDPLQ